METIAKVQELFANRYALGITVADARNVSKELFTIADERDEAIKRTGKYENDAVFAPRALRWLDEQEEKLLGEIGKNTNETGQDTWYNGEDSQPSASDDETESLPSANSEGYITVQGHSELGSNRKNPEVNCYGYILMYLGIQPSNGNYDIQPGQLSERDEFDHAHAMVVDSLEYTDTESIKDFIFRDIEQTGNSVRVIDSYEDAIEGETVVAMKNRDSVFNPDYHCAVLLSDGSWADKKGPGSDSRQGAIKDPDEPWGEWWERKYNSDTIYFAVSQP